MKTQERKVVEVRLDWHFADNAEKPFVGVFVTSKQAFEAGESPDAEDVVTVDVNVRDTVVCDLMQDAAIFACEAANNAKPTSAKQALEAAAQGLKATDKPKNPAVAMLLAGFEAASRKLTIQRGGVMKVTLRDTEGYTSGLEYSPRENDSLHSKRLWMDCGFGGTHTDSAEIDGYEMSGDAWRFFEGTLGLESVFAVLQNAELSGELMDKFLGQFGRTGNDAEALAAWESLHAEAVKAIGGVSVEQTITDKPSKKPKGASLGM